jgi:hypothetical protein
MELFVASDRPIDVSPGWKSERYLTVETASYVQGDIGRLFSLPHVRFLGAHTGCSCGFEYGMSQPESEAEREGEEAGRRSVEALRDFLETYLRTGAALELISCWEGAGWPDPHKVTEVSPAFFGGQSFELPRSAFLKVHQAVEQ